MTGLARLLNNARGASTGKGSIVEGHVSPATFATIAASSNMTRTIRMALAGNAVTGVDISPPYEDKPDRVPLGPGDEKGVVDPVGRGHHSGARLGTDRVAGRVRSQGSDLRRLYPLRHRPHLCRRAARDDQGLRGPGRGLRRALCPHSGPPARPPGDQVHGRQQGPRSLARADRTRPRADSVPGFGAHDDRHDRRRGDGIPCARKSRRRRERIRLRPTAPRAS